MGQGGDEIVSGLSEAEGSLKVVTFLPSHRLILGVQVRLCVPRLLAADDGTAIDLSGTL